MNIGNDTHEAFGPNERYVNSQMAIPVIQAYINASNELVARRVLNANKAMRDALVLFYGTALDGLDIPPRIAIRRHELLRNSTAIGATNAFFAAAERRKLPYPLLQYPNESTNDKQKLPSDLIPLLQAAFDATDQGSLQQAIDSWEQVLVSPSLKQCPVDTQITFRDQLATTRYRYYGITAEPELLDRAISLWVETIGMVVDDTPDVAGLYNNLGNAYDARYWLTGHIGDLEAANSYHVRAVDESPIGHPIVPTTFMSYGGSLWYRFQRTKDAELLQRSKDAYERALRWSPPDDPNVVGIQANLSDIYYELLQRSIFLSLGRGAKQYSKLAVRYGKKAIKSTSINSPDYPRHAKFYARALDGAASISPPGRRYKANMSRATKYIEKAIEVAPSHSPELAGYLKDYADILRKTSYRDRVDSTGDKIKALYRESCQIGLDTEPLATIASAQAWALYAAQDSAWADAYEARHYALRAMRILFHAQALRGHQETWLHELHNIPVETAYAAAMADRPRDAVLALEQGRAMILSESLSRELVDLSQAIKEGHEAEVARFRRASQTLTALQAQTAGITRSLVHMIDQQDSDARLEQLEAARLDYAAALRAIQLLPGHEEFLKEASYEDVARAASFAPLVYLVAADKGGLALGVATDGEPKMVLLPELKRMGVAERVQALDGAYARRSTDSQTWRTELEDVCRWLWDAALSSCFEHNIISNRAILIPTGQLAALPLHAAWREDAAAVSGRRYAIDDALLTYAPTALAISAGEQRIASAGSQSILIVTDPSPVSAPHLPNVEAEAGGAARFFTDRVRLHGSAATVDAVLKVLPNHPVQHFACHARADHRNPLESGLLLSSNKWLRLIDIMNSTVRRPRLSFLSACETSVIGEDLPDEMIGFHTGLLQAGMPGVIGSLWAVLDESTSILVQKFYEFWRNGDSDQPEALRQAQRWVRDATNEELAPIRNLDVHWPPGTAAYRVWSKARPYQDPTFWAAFVYTGV